MKITRVDEFQRQQMTFDDIPFYSWFEGKTGDYQGLFFKEVNHRFAYIGPNGPVIWTHVSPIITDYRPVEVQEIIIKESNRGGGDSEAG